LAEAAAGSPSRINDTPQFFGFLSCENLNPPYIIAVARNEGAPGDQAKGAEKKFLFGIAVTH
jgi:hypothetical protein